MTLEEILTEYEPEPMSGCWLWLGGRWGRYGHVDLPRSSGRRRQLAHRYVYERLVGAIPDGYELDHLCRNTVCVNPKHLEPVTHQENTRRAWAIVTSCPAGHPYELANTYIDRTGGRRCKRCNADRAAKRRAAR